MAPQCLYQMINPINIVPVTYFLIIFNFDLTNQCCLIASISGGPIISSKHRSHVPQYDSINDPHLREYFERKFSLSSAVRVH